jgi:ectoine hydroxylase-related dioxygenase (phytanoyl-CoA dioxygenase family)
LNKLDEQGFLVIGNLISNDKVLSLLQTLNKYRLKPGQGGIRRIERLVPDIMELAYSLDLMQVVNACLSKQAHLVRAIYFDKSAKNNWFVSWHQDKTVAVSQRLQASGWEPWSLKTGVWHVQPPLAVLQSMVTLRLHLDDVTKANGCLKVIPYSHRDGLLTPASIADKVKAQECVYCETYAGGAVLMRPHLLHASDKSNESSQRRLLHFEYSDYELPKGLKWAT